MGLLCIFHGGEESSEKVKSKKAKGKTTTDFTDKPIAAFGRSQNIKPRKTLITPELWDAGIGWN